LRDTGASINKEWPHNLWWVGLNVIFILEPPLNAGGEGGWYR